MALFGTSFGIPCSGSLSQADLTHRAAFYERAHHLPQASRTLAVQQATFTHGIDVKGYYHTTFLVVTPQLAAWRRIYDRHEVVSMCCTCASALMLQDHVLAIYRAITLWMTWQTWYATVLEVIPWSLSRSLQTSWFETVMQKAIFTHGIDEKGSRHLGYTWSALSALVLAIYRAIILWMRRHTWYATGLEVIPWSLTGSLQTCRLETVVQKAMFTHDIDEKGSRHLGHTWSALVGISQHWWAGWRSLTRSLQTSWSETAVQKAIFTHDVDEKGY
eukprot:s884_g47.t1